MEKEGPCRGFSRWRALRRPRAWIISIGNELLIGRVVNTNAAWIASRLTLRGVNVERIMVVPDRLDDIVEAVGEACRRAEIVVTTGGLGPTDDDITMEAVAAALHQPLLVDEEAKHMVEEFYRRAGLGLTRERLKMARLPASAKPIPNPVGAAPGAYIVAGGCQLFVLPGVPAEMQAMMDHVIELLEPVLPKLCVAEEGVTIKGVPESSLAPLLRRASKRCPDCYTKSHPKGHETMEPIIEVKVLASGKDCEEAQKKARNVLEELRRLLEEVERGGQQG